MTDVDIPRMDAGRARQLGRQVKAALLHLSVAEDLAEAAGVDLTSPYADDPGAGPLFRAARDTVEDLDTWAINTAGANGAGRVTYAHTERWCHAAGGRLPTTDSPADSEAVTAARMLAIAAWADALVVVIEQASADFRALGEGAAAGRPADTFTTDDLVRRAGFRLGDAAGQARQLGAEMRETAADLERIAAVPADACRIPWPVCPEHGNTITSTGGRSWCRVARCERRWDYDRGAIPCPEPTRWRVTDMHGEGGLMCEGHARDARAVLEGASVVPLAEGSEGDRR